MYVIFTTAESFLSVFRFSSLVSSFLVSDKNFHFGAALIRLDNQFITEKSRAAQLKAKAAATV